MVLISIPIFMVWYYCADLLILLKQDPAISADAGRYVWRMAPSLIPYLWFEVMKKWLIAQRIVSTPSHSPHASHPCHPH
jgi:MATE family multidrug resistance protein